MESPTSASLRDNDQGEKDKGIIFFCGSCFFFVGNECQDFVLFFSLGTVFPNKLVCFLLWEQVGCSTSLNAHQ